MVQRKDSLSYVEFMRGKYDLRNVKYIMQLVSNMTEDERKKLETGDFDALWKGVWSVTTGRNFEREHQDSKRKFQILSNGYVLKTQPAARNSLCIETSNSNESQDADNEQTFVSLQQLLQTTKSALCETEWGFPKGRRNFSDEDDKRCAMREFREETGMQLRNIKFIKNMKPFEEVFSGTNSVRYKHVYYVCKFCPWTTSDTCSSMVNPKNKQQMKEIKDVQWFNYSEAQNKIPSSNVERRELLKRINNVIVKYINNM